MGFPLGVGLEPTPDFCAQNFLGVGFCEGFRFFDDFFI